LYFFFFHFSFRKKPIFDDVFIFDSSFFFSHKKTTSDFAPHKKIKNKQMPPKKTEKKRAGSAKGGSKKGKKKKEDEDAALQRYLDDMFYVPRPTREAQREKIKGDIRATFSYFQGDKPGLCDALQLPSLVSALGVNPSVSQLRAIHQLTSDDSQAGQHTVGVPTSGNIIYEKFETLMCDVLQTRQLQYNTLITPPAPPPPTDPNIPPPPPPALVTKKELVTREPERILLQAFDAVWTAHGRKQDADGVRFVDGDRLREALCKEGVMELERLSEEEAKDFFDAASDADSGMIREDMFAKLLAE
jgi:hypothetical protein